MHGLKWKLVEGKPLKPGIYQTNNCLIQTSKSPKVKSCIREQAHHNNSNSRLSDSFHSYSQRTLTYLERKDLISILSLSRGGVQLGAISLPPPLTRPTSQRDSAVIPSFYFLNTTSQPYRNAVPLGKWYVLIVWNMENLLSFLHSALVLGPV